MDELFEMDELEKQLCEAGLAVDRRELRSPWQTNVEAMLAETQLQLPNAEWQVNGGRRGVHTEHLGQMLSEMQFLQRAYPGLSW